MHIELPISDGRNPFEPPTSGDTIANYESDRFFDWWVGSDTASVGDDGQDDELFSFRRKKNLGSGSERVAGARGNRNG